MKKSSSGVNLDGVLLFGFLGNPRPLWDFRFRLTPTGSASPGSHYTRKMHQWLDNVGFIGTENIIGSNRCRERFSDFETRKLFLFRKPLYLHPCLPAKVPS